MFCKNCGNPIEEGASFCPACGTPVEASEPVEIPETPVANEPAAETVPEIPAEPVNEIPAEAVPEPAEIPAEETECVVTGPEKKRGKKGIVFAGIAVVVAALVLAAVLFFETILQAFMPAPVYFRRVAQKSANNFTENIAETVDRVDEASDLHSAKGTFALNLTEDGAALINKYINADLGACSLDIDYDCQTEDGLLGIDLGLKLDGNDFATVQLGLDIENKYAYVTIPELNKDCIRFDLGKLLGSANIDLDNDALKSGADLMEILPESDEVKGILDRAFKAAIAEIENVKKSSGTLEANGLKKKYNAYTLSLDDETVCNIADAALKQLRDDAEVKEVVDDVQKLPSVTEENLYQSYQKAIDKASESIAEAVKKDDNTYALTCFVDAKGRIVGETVSVNGEDTIKVAYVCDGKKFGYKLESTAKMPVLLEGGGTNSGDIINGKLTLSVDGVDYVDLALEDVCTKEEKMSGKITATLPDQCVNLLKNTFGENISLVSDMALSFEFDRKSENAASSALTLSDSGKALVVISEQATTGKDGKVTLAAQYVDGNDEAALDKWTQGISNNLMGLYAKLASSKWMNLFNYFIGAALS